MNALVPPPQQKIPEAIEREVLRLTRENFGGCKLIARRLDISHTSVLRIWRRHGIDREQLAARNTLVEANRDLAIRIAKSVAADLPMHMREDLSGVAMIALTEAAGSFDPGNAGGAKFTSWAHTKIRGACLDSVRRRHYANANAGEYTAEQSEARTDTTESHETTAIESEAKRIRRAKAVEVILRLPGRLAVLLWLHYLEGQTLEVIAPKLGVVASRLSQLHREGIAILKKQMGEKT